MTKRVLIISFSNKKSGNCEQISELIQENLDAETEIFRFSENPIHACGHCRYQCFDDNRCCPYYDDPEFGLLRSVCLSDLVYFVVPNYCDYPCANFFIFNERSQVYFQGYRERLMEYEAIPKRFIVVSDSESGNFATAFDYHCEGTPEILYVSAKKYGKHSIAGDILKSQQARMDILKFIQADAE